MKARSYADVREHLSNREPFYHSSMSAHLDSDGTYVVSSYATPVAWHRPDGTLDLTEDHYSSTTTKHVNMAKNALFGKMP